VEDRKLKQERMGYTYTG